MKKVVPTFVGPTKDRFFVLYDSGDLHYYDREELLAERLMGKINLKRDVQAIEVGRAHYDKQVHEGVLTLRAGAARPEIAKREALEDLDAAALAALQRAVSQMSQR